MLTVPVDWCSTRSSVVIRNPERKKNTVTPNPPGTGSTKGSSEWAQNTIKKLTARKPSRDGIWSTGPRGGRGDAIAAIGWTFGDAGGESASVEVTVFINSVR